MVVFHSGPPHNAPHQAHLNPPRRIKGRPVKAFAAKTVFSASISAGFPSPSAIWIPPPAAMEQLDVLRLRSRIPRLPLSNLARSGGQAAVTLPPRSIAVCGKCGPGSGRGSGRRSPSPGKRKCSGISGGIPTSSARMSRTQGKVDDPGRTSRAGTHHDRAHRDRGDAGAGCRGLWRCAAELARGGVDQSGSGGDRNAQAERASFAIDRGEGIVHSSRRVPRFS